MKKLSCAETFACRNFRAQKVLRVYTFANEQIIHFMHINFHEWKICVFSFSLPIVLIIGVDTKKHLFFVFRYTILTSDRIHTQASLRLIAIWQTVIALAIALASLKFLCTNVSALKIPITVPYPEIIWTHQFFNEAVPAVEKTS